MIKKNLSALILALIVCANTAWSQGQKIDTDIIIGEQFKNSKKISVSKIFGADDNGFYILKRKRKDDFKIIFEHYNSEMNQVQISEITFETKHKKRSYEFTIDLGDEIFVFSSFKNEKHKKNYLFAQSLNKTTLQLNNDLRKICEIAYEKKTKHNAGNFSYELSSDTTKILFYYNLPYKSNEKEKFAFNVYDHELNQLWRKEITLPYLDKLFAVLDYEIDNAGNVHLLGNIFNDKAKYERKGKPNSTYEILSYLNNGNSHKKYPITLGDKFINDLTFEINDNQDIVCGGFYSSIGAESIQGSYFLTIDHETAVVKSQNTKKFDLNFITQNLSQVQKKRITKKNKKGKSTEMNKYHLSDFVLKEDGGALFVAEKYYSEIYTTSQTDSDGRTTTTTHVRYFFKDIIVVNISQQGNIIWAEKIAKNQITSDDGGTYSSYTMLVKGTDLFFVFNDNIKNQTYNGSGKVKNFTMGKNGVAAIVKIDSQGNQTRDFVFSRKDTEFFVKPSISKQISDDQIILYGRKRKKQNFSLLTIDD